MPENVPLYMDLTVREFVGYMAELKMVPKKERKNSISNVIEQTGLSEVKNKLIKNLSRWLSKFFLLLTFLIKCGIIKRLEIHKKFMCPNINYVF